MNRYFLLIACLQLWSAITPVAPITTWGPLLVIFAISGLKEAIDDTRRYRNDNLANERLVTVLRDGRRQQIQSQHLLVGDVVYITEDEEFPADLLLLRSSEVKTGSCYIQTSNIDGETNLKQRVAAHKDYTQLLEESQMFQLDVVVECAQPNNNIYNFDSTLKLPREWKQQVAKRAGAGSSSSSSSQVETAFPLSSNNLLLQATYLRNTCWIYGLVVYAGNSSKVGCNKSPPQQKYTKVDETINQVTVVVFLTQVTMIVIWGFLGYHQEALHMTQSSVDGENGGWWYLVYENQPTDWVTPLIIPLRFLLLASMMIPISLKVSLDLIKLYYSMCINWDLQLWDETLDEPAKATNTSIAENLGQVAYVLSDKTGTLTENVMVFRKLAVADGKRYGENGGASTKENRRSSSGAKTPRSGALSPSVETGGILSDPALLSDLDGHSTPLIDLLRFMALCNTVVPSWIGGKPSHLRSVAHSDASSSGLMISPGSSLQDQQKAGGDGKKALSLEMAVSLPHDEIQNVAGTPADEEAVFARKPSDEADVIPVTKKSKKQKAKDAKRNSKQIALLDDELPSDSVLHHADRELNRGASVTDVGVTPTGSYQADSGYLDRQVSYTPSSVQRQPSTSTTQTSSLPHESCQLHYLRFRECWQHPLCFLVSR